MLFNKSIEENVRFAKWKATSGEVQQACKMAGIHDDIMQLKDVKLKLLNFSSTAVKIFCNVSFFNIGLRYYCGISWKFAVYKSKAATFICKSVFAKTEDIVVG